MRVHYRARRSRATGLVFEQTGPVKFCCDDMERQWGELIDFGVKGHPRTTSREVNILSVLRFATGTTIPVIAEIAFCPWCAEKITVIRRQSSARKK